MSTGPSLYRRHRPRTFADVVGQEHVVRTLSNAVEREKVHHAYLFVGSRGTGKTSMAKILAACLNCDRGPTIEPCGECESCTAIASANSLDVLEMDAASNNSVDDIRDLREKVAYAPVSGRHKVYILDEAHMLSPQAWNAFLKTLEEPPPRTIFVLATTEAQKVLPTVVDRCHRFDFGRPSVAQVGIVLSRVAEQEGIEIGEGALALIARHATGSFRDALGTLEQLVTYTSEGAIEPADVLAVLGIADAEQLFGALDAIVARDPARALRAADELAASGRDPGQVLRDLELHGRELLVVQVLGEVPPELRIAPDRDRRLADQAQALSRADAVRLLDLVSCARPGRAARAPGGDGAQARIQLELLLVKAAAPEIDPAAAALVSRIEQLEATLRTAASKEPGALPAAREAPSPSPSPESEPRASSTSRPAVSGQPPEPGSEAPAKLPAPPSAGETETDAPAVGPKFELQTAVALWPAVVETVRHGNAMLAALLGDARPVAVDECELTLAFPAGAAFLKRKAEQDDHRRLAVQALRSVTGQALALRFQLHDEGEQNGVHEQPGVPVLSGEELVRRFLDEFDAQELPADDLDQSNAPN